MKALPAFISAGEALTDLVHEGDGHWSSHAGGSTWNVARAMASLGVPSAFAGAISRDVFGAALAAASDAAGLDMRFLQQVDRSPLLAVVHQLNPPAYFFVGDDSADLHFDTSLLPSGWKAGAQWVHFGGISLARPPLSDTLISIAGQAKAEGARISYDPNFRNNVMDARYDSTLRRMVELADVIKVSDEDLAGLFRHDDIERAFRGLRAMHPTATYLLTQGSRGARLHQGGCAWQASPPPITLADTVGAGDASIAALLFSVMTRPDDDGRRHLAFAVAAGAAACEVTGPGTPGLPAVDALARQVRVTARV